MSYTKLANSILTSTLWVEEDHTRIAWIAMLALADKNGEVSGSIPGLASIARIPVDSCRAAIAKLLAPDPDSRTKDDEGRRIQEIDGGWLLLNHSKYRELASDDERKRKAAERQQRARDKAKRNPVTPSSRQIPHADADAESISKEKNTEPPDPDTPDAAAQPDFFHSKPSSLKKTPPTPALRAGSVKEQKPAQAEMEEFAKSLGLPRTDGQYCFEKWMGSGWKNGGKPIVSWQMTMRSWKTAGYLPSQQQPRNGNSAAAFAAPRNVRMGPL
jgi:hypothetical protein